MNRDRAAGTMFGLAVGDAMGMPVEFRPRGKFDPVTEFRAGPCKEFSAPDTHRNLSYRHL